MSFLWTFLVLQDFNEMKSMGLLKEEMENLKEESIV
jgi:hypothetical protein